MESEPNTSPEAAHDLANARSAAARRWTSIVTDPRAAVGYKTKDGWVRSAKAPANQEEHEQLGIFHRDRLWIETVAIEPLNSWLSDLKAIPLVDATAVKELGGYRKDDPCFCPEALGSKSVLRYVYGDGSGGLSAASRAAKTGWVLFDFSQSAGFDLFGVINSHERAASMELSPLHTFATTGFDLSPWDFGGFGTPRDPEKFGGFKEGEGGKGVTVVVSDSGMVSTLPLAADVDVLSDVVPGTPTDYEDPYDSSAMDIGLDAGHGIFIAGIIRQLAPAATVVMSRVWSSNRTLVSEDDVLADLATSMNTYPGKLILNWSLASHPGDAPNRHFDDQVTDALEERKNLIIVCAAGNDASERPEIRPSGMGHERMVSVGAVERSNGSGFRTATEFSNYGVLAKIWAVGKNIVAPFLPGTVHWTDENGVPQTETFVGAAPPARWSGTSFAAPVVAGAAAIAFSGSATATDAINILLANTVDIDVRGTVKQGVPFVDSSI